MPINIFREVYVSFQNLRRRLIAFNTYRRLTHNMDSRFESIKDEEELDRLGHTCIICRDTMDLLGGCKKLPGCGHAFHTHCLREWLVQQQTCPTCRADIAANEARRKKELERERRRAEVEAATAEQEGELPAADASADDNIAVDNSRPTEVATREPGVSQQQGSQGLTATRESGAAAAEASDEDQKEPGATSSTAKATDKDELPAGWTRHVDKKGSGKTFYCNKEVGQSTWKKPTEANAAANLNKNVTPDAQANNDVASTGPAISPSNGSPSKVLTPPPIFGNQQQSIFQPPLSQPKSAGFPCLYRVTYQSGAPIFPPSDSPRNNYGGGVGNYNNGNLQPPRMIPYGKLIVCTAIEYWSMPFQEAMLRMPEGYVRSRDAERFLMLDDATQNSQGEKAVQRRAAANVSSSLIYW